MTVGPDTDGDRKPITLYKKAAIDHSLLFKLELERREQNGDASVNFNLPNFDEDLFAQLVNWMLLGPSSAANLRGMMPFVKLWFAARQLGMRLIEDSIVSLIPEQKFTHPEIKEVVELVYPRTKTGNRLRFLLVELCAVKMVPALMPADVNPEFLTDLCVALLKIRKGPTRNSKNIWGDPARVEKLKEDEKIYEQKFKESRGYAARADDDDEEEESQEDELDEEQDQNEADEEDMSQDVDDVEAEEEDNKGGMDKDGELDEEPSIIGPSSELTDLPVKVEEVETKQAVTASSQHEQGPKRTISEEDDSDSGPVTVKRRVMTRRRTVR